MICKIHTLPVLRTEIKMYRALRHEQDKITEDYETPLRELENQLSEVEEKLILVKSPGNGDGLGGYVQDSLERYNYLIDKKTELEIKQAKYIAENRNRYIKEYFNLNERLETIEYYLEKLNKEDRNFIIDFYISATSKNEVMDNYNILNINSLYRKANNILLKML